MLIFKHYRDGGLFIFVNSIFIYWTKKDHINIKYTRIVVESLFTLTLFNTVIVHILAFTYMLFLDSC